MHPKPIAHTARAIVANPSPQHSAPLRLIAWATVKAERGQIVRQHRLYPNRAREPRTAPAILTTGGAA